MDFWKAKSVWTPLRPLSQTCCCTLFLAATNLTWHRSVEGLILLSNRLLIDITHLFYIYISQIPSDLSAYETKSNSSGGLTIGRQTVTHKTTLKSTRISRKRQTYVGLAIFSRTEVWQTSARFLPECKSAGAHVTQSGL